MKIYINLIVCSLKPMLNCSQLRLYFQFRLFYIHSQVKDVKDEARNRIVSCDIEILVPFLASLVVKAVQALHLSSASSGWIYLPVNLFVSLLSSSSYVSVNFQLFLLGLSLLQFRHEKNRRQFLVDK